MSRFENLRMEKSTRQIPLNLRLWRETSACRDAVVRFDEMKSPLGDLGVRAALLFILILLFSSCKIYSLREGSIPPDIKSVTINQFTNQSNNGSTIISQKLTNAMKDRFVQQTSLRQVDQGGDIEFKGAIINYQIAGNAPTANQTTALNRLTVTVKVEFINNKHEKDSWTNTFSQYSEYESSKNLVQVEDALLTDIYDKLVTDIYNKALVNW